MTDHSNEARTCMDPIKHEWPPRRTAIRLRHVYEGQLFSGGSERGYWSLWVGLGALGFKPVQKRRGMVRLRIDQNRSRFLIPRTAASTQRFMSGSFLRMPTPQGTLRKMFELSFRELSFAATPTRNASSYIIALAWSFLTASTPAAGLETTWNDVFLEQFLI